MIWWCFENFTWRRTQRVCFRNHNWGNANVNIFDLQSVTFHKMYFWSVIKVKFRSSLRGGYSYRGNWLGSWGRWHIMFNSSHCNDPGWIESINYNYESDTNHHKSSGSEFPPYVSVYWSVTPCEVGHTDDSSSIYRRKQYQVLPLTMSRFEPKVIESLNVIKSFYFLYLLGTSSHAQQFITRIE